jgi:hypothetical protein
MALTLREHCDRRLASMKQARTDYDDEWRQIARFAQPSRSRFLATDTNKGGQRRFWNKRLFDPHGIEAARTLTNGMTSGLTSASRPWFMLTIDGIDDQPGVRDWLSDVETEMYKFLAQTNFYGAVKAGYGEMGLFGTEACVMVEHRTAGAVCHTLTAGEYWIAESDARVPDTLVRECPMTARQIVQTFAKDAPTHVVDSYDRGDAERVVTLLQMIEPNADYQPDNIGSKPWRSVYWDCISDKAKDNDGILRESGFAEQPFWAPRWDVVGGDTYGISPGMEALPALRELQMQAKRRNEAIDQMVKPEMIVKAGVRLTGEPGRKVSAASIDGQNTVTIPYQIPYQAVNAIGEEIAKCRQQIDSLMFADLFNAITNMQGIQPRNVEEIASRNEEKMTQLGPVIERVSNEKLEVAIDRTFGIMMRGGLLPKPPEALQGMKINVEFVSILTQMQRAVGIGQIERSVGFVGSMAAANPEVLDNLDGDETVREYFNRAGAPAKTLRSETEVKQIRTQRAQQKNAEQAAAMMAPVKDGADAAQLLSQTNVGGKPMLDTLMGA